jgi:hypothetical protein
MVKFVVAFVIVAVILLGGLMTLVRNWRQPMGSPEVLERAKQRNREIEAEEQRDDDSAHSPPR